MMYFSPPSFNPGGNKSIVFPLILNGSLSRVARALLNYHSNTHFHAHTTVKRRANLSAGKKEKGNHLVSFVTSKQIGVEKGRTGDGCVSLCGLLRAIVPSYLLETACTVAAFFGRPCLFVFDLLGAPCSALGPQVNMHSFQIKAGLLALITHLGMMEQLLVRNDYFVSVLV